MDKGYLPEIHQLEKKINLEEAYLSYEDTFSLIRDFFKTIILSNLDALKISEKTTSKIKFYIGKSDAYADGLISEAEINSQMAEAWGDFKSLADSDQKLMRLILCCLIGKEKYLKSVDEDMQDDYISMILILSYKLHQRFGKIFKEFVQSHPAMQKYKISDDLKNPT